MEDKRSWVLQLRPGTAELKKKKVAEKDKMKVVEELASPVAQW